METILKQYTDNNGNVFDYYRLKDCPFCGGKPELNFIGNSYTKNRKVEIKCTDDCRCKMVNAGASTNSLELARMSIDLWNKRIKNDDCTNCKHDIRPIPKQCNDCAYSHVSESNCNYILDS